MFGSIFGSVAGSVLGSVTSSLLGGGSSGGSSGGSGFSMTDLIGPALQVGGSLLGGHLKNESNEEINAHELRLARDQFEWQRQYAHNRLQWQVEDAKKAGLHPMVAAGLSPVSFSPVSANLSPNDYDWVSDIGQSLNYAATKGKDKAMQREMLGLQIQGLQLENKYKQAQIDNLNVDTLASSIASNQALNSPSAPAVNNRKPVVSAVTGLTSPEDAATHIWNMGHGNYSILWNPEYTQTIGDEAGQVFNIADAAKKAYKDGTFVDPETGVTYVYNKDTGWWNRLDSLSPEEADRLLGKFTSRPSGPSSSHRVRNAYRYR